MTSSIHYFDYCKKQKLKMRWSVMLHITSLFSSFISNSWPWNKLVIGWLFAQLTISWDSLYLNFKLSSSFGLGQFLFRNNSSQLIVNCTHDMANSTTDLSNMQLDWGLWLGAGHYYRSKSVFCRMRGIIMQ